MIFTYTCDLDLWTGYLLKAQNRALMSNYFQIHLWMTKLLTWHDNLCLLQKQKILESLRPWSLDYKYGSCMWHSISTCHKLRKIISNPIHQWQKLWKGHDNLFTSAHLTCSIERASDFCNQEVVCSILEHGNISVKTDPNDHLSLTADLEIIG